MLCQVNPMTNVRLPMKIPRIPPRLSLSYPLGYSWIIPGLPCLPWATTWATPRQLNIPWAIPQATLLPPPWATFKAFFQGFAQRVA